MTNPFSCHIWLHSSINIQPPSLEASIVMKWARGEALLLLPHNCEVAHLNVGSQLLRVLQLAELLPTLGNVSFMEDSKYSMWNIPPPVNWDRLQLTDEPIVNQQSTNWMDALWNVVIIIGTMQTLSLFFFFGVWGVVLGSQCSSYWAKQRVLLSRLMLETKSVLFIFMQLTRNSVFACKSS